MSRPEPPAAPGSPPPSSSQPAPPSFAGDRPVGVPGPRGSRYRWFVGVVALLVLTLITINTLTTAPNGSNGVPPGKPLPPFAVPLAVGTLTGDANVATRANQGAAGRRPACSVRGPQIVNVCQLYEQGPLVLALFVNASSCPAILDDLERLRPEFPGVHFAAVALGGDRGRLRTLVRTHRLGYPVGYDRPDQLLVNLYKLASCPQVNFAFQGGIVAERALLFRPPLATLRARVSTLVTAARARGSTPPA